jgi:CheY-like chemotaxis protein
MDFEQAIDSYQAAPASVIPSLLVVDRDESVGEKISAVFSDSSVRIVQARTGMQGYWLALNERPSLIVTDLGMPNGSGGEVLQCLKSDAHTKDIPIVVLTGQSYPGMHQHLERVGAAAVLDKPLQATQLIETVSQLLVQI